MTAAAEEEEEEAVVATAAQVFPQSSLATGRGEGERKGSGTKATHHGARTVGGGGIRHGMYNFKKTLYF